MVRFVKKTLSAALLLNAFCAADQHAAETAQERASWMASITLNDAHGSFISYEKLKKRLPDPNCWSIEEFSLACDTLRIRNDTEALTDISQQLTDSPSPSSQQKHRIVCEKMAWAILSTGLLEHHPKLRFESILGAAMSQESLAIPFVIAALNDDNSYLRQFGLNVAASFPDRAVQNKLLQITASGSHQERLSAAGILLSQEMSGGLERAIEMSREAEWTENEKVALLTLRLQHDPALAAKLLASDCLTANELRSLIRLELQLPSKRFPELLRKILSTQMHQHDVLTESLALIGCRLKETDAATREQICAFISPWISSPIYSVRIRALWCLRLLNPAADEPSRELLRLAICTENQHIQTEAARHIRALGPAGVSLAQAALENPEKLQPENLMTLCLYLVEQQAPQRERAAQLLIKTVKQTKDLYINTDESMGITFENIARSNGSIQDPFFSKARDAADLMTRLQLFSAALQTCPSAITSHALIELLHERDAAGAEYLAIQLLHGELHLCMPEIESALFDKDPGQMKALSVAFIMAMSRQEDRALEIIEPIIAKKNSSKDTVETALGCLAYLPIEKTDRLISPWMSDSSKSIRLRAAGAFLSSMTR